jgi:hypothetical protein
LDAVPAGVVTVTPSAAGVTVDAGYQFPMGNTTVLFMALDEAGLNDTCSIVVTVTDAQSPNLTCPPGTPVNTAELPLSYCGSPGVQWSISQGGVSQEGYYLHNFIQVPYSTPSMLPVSPKVTVATQGCTAYLSHEGLGAQATFTALIEQGQVINGGTLLSTLRPRHSQRS